MSRTISLTLTDAINSQESGEMPVVLLTIEHPDIDGTLRLASAAVTRLSDAPLQYGVVSNGETFLFAPMTISLPDDVEGRAPTSRLSVENVSRDLIEIVRSVTTPGTCTIQLVLASAPDDIEIEWPTLDIRGAQFNANVVNFEFGLDAMDREPFPGGTFAPSGFPSLF